MKMKQNMGQGSRFDAWREWYGKQPERVRRFINDTVRKRAPSQFQKLIPREGGLWKSERHTDIAPMPLALRRAFVAACQRACKHFKLEPPAP
jgi:hypothetical protein